MNQGSNDLDAGQHAITRLLQTGTYLGSAMLALGMLAGMLGRYGVVLPAWLDSHHLLLGGIVIFVVLPVARVVTTLITFACARDFTYMALSGFVLLVIAFGVLWELRLP